VVARLPWLQGRELQEAVPGAKSNRWHFPCYCLPFHLNKYRLLKISYDNLIN